MHIFKFPKEYIMQFNGTLRKIIPICSMLIALGTVAFQTIENSAKKEKLEKLQKTEVKTSQKTEFTYE